MSNRLQLQDAQTFLFVPANRPDRFDKASASGADVVIIDLEDSVAPDEKDAAREHVSAWLAAGGRAAVRVNAARTPWFHADMAAMNNAMAVVVPKVEGADDLNQVTEFGPTGLPAIPLIETAGGVMSVQETCAAPNVVRVALGNVDLAADLGVDPASRLALSGARSQLVLASRAARLAPPIDGVTTDIGDKILLADDAQHARDLGFTAKLTIHPNQVPVVANVFRTTTDEVDWAIGVLRSAGDGVQVHDGHMIDEPVRARARSILRRAGHTIASAGVEVCP
ncbi:CoA ester lyase [Nocardioides sp. 1609]|uniref:HpcH/HpaI aldolase/citrate lyase family protein n=1 Tax=Nocardioides sp. 1609 TaxID=2508327 RepID=UPI00106FEDE0|nr:CoA ester lyase [Nocardioides sp. 1609]